MDPFEEYLQGVADRYKAPPATESDPHNEYLKSLAGKFDLPGASGASTGLKAPANATLGDPIVPSPYTSTAAKLLMDHSPVGTMGLPFAKGVTDAISGIGDSAYRWATDKQHTGERPVGKFFDDLYGKDLLQQDKRIMNASPYREVMIEQGVDPKRAYDESYRNRQGRAFTHGAGSFTPGMALGMGMGSVLGKGATALGGAVGGAAPAIGAGLQGLGRALPRYGGGAEAPLPGMTGLGGLAANAGTRVLGAAIPGAATGSAMDMEHAAPNAGLGALGAVIGGPVLSAGAKGAVQGNRLRANLYSADRVEPMAANVLQGLTPDPAATARALERGMRRRTITQQTPAQMSRDPTLGAVANFAERAAIDDGVAGVGNRAITGPASRVQQQDQMTSSLANQFAGLPQLRQNRRQATEQMYDDLLDSQTPVSIGQLGGPTGPIDDVLRRTSGFPNENSELRRALDPLRGEQVVPPGGTRTASRPELPDVAPTVPTQTLVGMNQNINAMTRDSFRLANNQPVNDMALRQLQRFQPSLREAIENSPEGALWIRANAEYADLSRDIGRQSTMEKIFNDARPKDTVLGQTTLSPASVLKSVRELRRNRNEWSRLTGAQQDYLVDFARELQVLSMSPGSMSRLSPTHIADRIGAEVMPPMLSRALDAPLRTSRLGRVVTNVTGGPQRERVAQALSTQDPNQLLRLLRMRDSAPTVSPMIDQLLRQTGNVGSQTARDYLGQ